MNQIDQFIREHLRKGYSLDEIKRHLVEYGVAPELIDPSIHSSQKSFPTLPQKVHHEHSLSIGAMLFLGVLILSGMFIGYFFFFTHQQPLLDVEIQITTHETYTGESYNFITVFTNQGSKNKFDVEVTYTLISLSNEVVLAYTETKAISTVNKHTSSFIIPEKAATGEYYISVVVTYAGETAKAQSIPFEIIQRQCDLCNDQNSCTKDVCDKSTKYQCSHEKIIPCCGNGICEENEICQADCTIPVFDEVQQQILQAKSIAKNNPEGARGLCEKLPSTLFVDGCYSKIAEESFNFRYCQLISDAYLSDYCILKIIFANNDYTLCNQIKDYQSKEDCFSLRKT